MLALGRAEGLAFVATRDAAGLPLRRDCTYRIEGTTPPARFWTLHATDAARRVIVGRQRKSALHSLELLRQPDSSFSIAVGRHPAPGNWLGIEGAGAMRFVLTLYDTPVAGSTGVTDIEMPAVLNAGCDA